MSSDDPLSRLLQAERRVSPEAPAVERGWQRLARDLTANVAPMPLALGPLKLSFWVVPQWLLGGFVIGLVGAGLLMPPRTPNRVSTAEPLPGERVAPLRTHSPAASAFESTTAAALTAPIDAGRAPSTFPTVARSGPASALSAPASVAAAPTTFDAELKLILRAKSELEAHQPALSRATLAEHAARFPAGVFGTERDALDVLAACEGGSKSATLATEFAEHHPGSPLLTRIQHACSNATQVQAQPSAAMVDFSRLPNETPPVGEPMAKPDGGEQR
jgi:hypothetical protein